MQGGVKSWQGLAATVQFTPWSIWSTRSLFTHIYLQFITIIQKGSAIIILLCVVSSVRPPNYNTSLMLSELMITCSRQLPDRVGSMRNMLRGVKCRSVITRFNVLYVQGAPDCMCRLTKYHIHCSRKWWPYPECSRRNDSQHKISV